MPLFELLPVLLLVPHVFCRAPTSLKMVHIVYRHGIKNPDWLFPADTNNKALKGEGKLRTEGMSQMYNLGRFIRHRYRGFISDEYLESETFIRSIDMNRALNSAYCTLAGLYPPSGDQVWNKHIRWQPIPVHTVSRESEHIFPSQCPRYIQKLIDNLASDFGWIEKKYEKLITQLKKNVSFVMHPEVKTPSLFISNLYDVLFVEKFLNLKWVPWVREDIYKLLGDLTRIILHITFKNNAMIRLKNGLFFRAVKRDMIGYRSGKRTRPHKMIIYSARKHAILGTLFGLQNYNEIIPPYASAVLFELHEIGGIYTVRVFYKNDTIYRIFADPVLLSLPGCGSACTLDQFTRFIEPVTIETIDEYEHLCGNNTYILDKRVILEVWFFFSLCIVVVIVIAKMVRSSFRRHISVFRDIKLV